MDNVTHAIAGMLLAEAGMRSPWGRSPSPRLRPAVFVTSILANNLPDLDFVYTAVTGGKLGYLLHHRGHTHTLLAAPLFALLCALGLWVWARARQIQLSRENWRLLLTLASVGPLVHVTMDFSNNYGVHPFWPVSSRWYYGDSVFIVEPWFWMSALPALALLATTRLSRYFYVTLIAAILALGVFTQAVPWPVYVSLLLWAAGFGFLLSRLRPGWRIVLGIGACLVTFGTLVTAASLARGHLAEAERAAFPNATTHDRVVTPAPGNPLCFSALLVQTADARFFVRQARVALLPGLLPAERCPRRFTGEPSAPLAPIAASATPHVTWQHQFMAPLDELRQLYHEDCVARAFLRFARTPFWTSTLLGDLRYDREPELGFAELERSEPERRTCPDWVPPWRPPRSDVLGL